MHCLVSLVKVECCYQRCSPVRKNSEASFTCEHRCQQLSKVYKPTPATCKGKTHKFDSFRDASVRAMYMSCSWESRNGAAATKHILLNSCFSTVRWCKGDTQLAETVLSMLNFDLCWISSNQQNPGESGAAVSLGSHSPGSS